MAANWSTLKARWRWVDHDTEAPPGPLVTCSAFTPAAFTFAVDQLRRDAIGARRSRLNKFEQSEQGWP
jgi:hypothetical protein